MAPRYLSSESISKSGGSTLAKLPDTAAPDMPPGDLAQVTSGPCAESNRPDSFSAIDHSAVGGYDFC